MCLGIPAQVIELIDDDPLSRMARVTFGGITKEISLVFTDDVAAGDYVIVHIGFAISKIDPKEAAKVFEYLQEIDELDELIEEDSHT